MSQRYDLNLQLQFVIMSLKNWKNWFFNCNKIFVWRNKYWSSIFSDYFQVRYFQIFSISKTTALRNFVLSAKDRENHKKKNDEKKIFLTKNLEVRYFQITADVHSTKLFASIGLNGWLQDDSQHARFSDSIIVYSNVEQLVIYSLNSLFIVCWWWLWSFWRLRSIANEVLVDDSAAMVAPKLILRLQGHRFLHWQKNVIEAQKLMVFQSKHI